MIALSTWIALWAFEINFEYLFVSSEYLKWVLSIWHELWVFEMSSEYLKWALGIWNELWVTKMNYSDCLKWAQSTWNELYIPEMSSKYLKWAGSIWNELWVPKMSPEYQKWAGSEYLKWAREYLKWAALSTWVFSLIIMTQLRFSLTSISLAASPTRGNNVQPYWAIGS